MVDLNVIGITSGMWHYNFALGQSNCYAGIMVDVIGITSGMWHYDFTLGMIALVKEIITYNY